MRGTHYKPPRGVDESKTPAGRGGWCLFRPAQIVLEIKQNVLFLFPFHSVTYLTKLNHSYIMDVMTFPVTMKKAGQPDKTANNEAQYNAFGKQGYKPKSESVAQNSSSGGKTPGGLRILTPEQAKKLHDLNLQNSFGIPSGLAEMGEGYEDVVTVLAIVEKDKKSGKGTFPALQVEWNGTAFLILYDGKSIAGDAVSFRLDATEATRSGLTLTLID